MRTISHLEGLTRLYLTLQLYLCVCKRCTLVLCQFYYKYAPYFILSTLFRVKLIMSVLTTKAVERRNRGCLLKYASQLKPEQYLKRLSDKTESLVKRLQEKARFV